MAGLRQRGIRVSVFMNPDIAQIERVPATGADRIELYTEPYAAAHGGALQAAELARFAAAARAADGGPRDASGLLPDGVIGAATNAALQVTPRQRVRQLELALERLRWTPLLQGPRMVVINIPEFVLRAYEVRDGRIAALGTSKEIRALAGPNTRILDAQGRLVLPGFNDALLFRCRYQFRCHVLR